jgi:hypothetical protein
VIEAVTELAPALMIVPLMPGLPDTTADAAERVVPVKVTGKAVPTVPDAGATAFKVGVPAVVAKETL